MLPKVSTPSSKNAHQTGAANDTWTKPFFEAFRKSLIRDALAARDERRYKFLARGLTYSYMGICLITYGTCLHYFGPLQCRR